MKAVRLYIEPEAEAELETTADRYAESVPGLGLEFLGEMRKRTRDVLEHPERFPWFAGNRVPSQTRAQEPVFTA